MTNQSFITINKAYSFKYYDYNHLNQNLRMILKSLFNINYENLHLND